MSTAAPLSFQIPSIERHLAVLAKNPGTLEASVPGFGKTFVAAFVARELGLTPCVIAPKSVLPHWRRALAACGTKTPAFVSNPEQVKLDRFEHGEWEIRNRRWSWNLPEHSLMILDECHRYKDRTTQTAKFMVAAARQGIKTIAASATAAKDPMDLYALGLLLGLHNGNDFLGLCFQYGMVKGPLDFRFSGRLEDLERLHRLIFPAHGYRATYDQIPGFPENTTVALGVEIEKPKQLDAIWARVQELQGLKETAAEAVVDRLRARQLAELQKVPAFCELIKDHLAEGMSVAVFLNFSDTIDALLEKFPRTGCVRGGQAELKRQHVIDEFQADRSRLIFCQAAAGGVGISLHDTLGTYPRVSLISPPESAILLVQILGRIRRAGAKTPALQKIVFAEGTIEEGVRRGVEKKVDQIDTINDGDLDPLKVQ